MAQRLETSVLIVGAGPVGMTLALDLAWRGIDSIVVEQRHADERPKPRANHVSARAMETYRRLGIAGEIRKTGLPGDYPTDIVWMTTMSGHELARIRLPCHDQLGKPGYADSDWPTPEPQHKINQMYLEPILWYQARSRPEIRLMHGVRLDKLHQEPTRVTGRVIDVATGEAIEVIARYLVGCDGGASGVRRAIGSRFEGDPVLTQVVSLHICAPDLLRRISGPPAHRYFFVNREQIGGAVTLNGRDLWSIHVMLPRPDSDPADLDRDHAIRAMTGFGPDFTFEIFAEDAWTGRRLLADVFQRDRVFLAGDAAHIWVPNAGYGMNAGIADAENLAWRLAAVLEGWGGPSLLDGYARERRPITDQVSKFAKDLAIRNRAEDFRSPPPELTMDGPEGDAVRRRFGAALYQLNLPQFTPSGLNFAYFYDDSPNISYDGEDAPAYSLGKYVPSTVPGCRVPHFFRFDHSSVYDHLGHGFTLLRLDPAVDVAPLLAAAMRRGVPMDILDVDPVEAGPAFRHRLVLSRPDRHVAWRANLLPADPMTIVDIVSGWPAA